MSKKTTRYAIYKKTKGTPYPGEFWDGYYTERSAFKLFRDAYGNDRKTFRIVKIVEEVVV